MSSVLGNSPVAEVRGSHSPVLEDSPMGLSEAMWLMVGSRAEKYTQPEELMQATMESVTLSLVCTGVRVCCAGERGLSLL
jgi:hypothetical protein